MDKDGTLHWNVPKGNWTVLRIGYTTTAVTNKPLTKKGGLGLEIDKLSRKAADIHWNELLNQIIADAEEKKAFYHHFN